MVLDKAHTCVNINIHLKGKLASIPTGVLTAGQWGWLHAEDQLKQQLEPGNMLRHVPL